MNANAIPIKASSSDKTAWWASGAAIVLWIAAAKLILHLLTASRYGFFGDEMYHLACGEHLDWGYVDQPPLIALVAWIVRHVLGESLLAVRFIPAVCGATLVWLAGALVREFGGGRFAQTLAALATACAGIYFVMSYLFTMNAWEPLIWMGCAWLVIRIIKTGNQKLWVWFGALAGLGLENKYSMGVFGFGVVVGLLLTPERRALAQKWIWIGGVIALLIFLPNILWNIRHDWPFLELMRNIRAAGRDIAVGPVEFMARQMFLMNFVGFLIALAGLLWILLAREGKKFRVLAWTFLTVLATFIALKGKDYYPTPAYPMMFAAGGVAIEAFTRRRMAWLKPALVVALLAVTIALLPIVSPVFSPENYLRYQEKLPFPVPATERSHMYASLPHHFAWQFGWPEMVAAVARVYNSLPAEERAKTAIFGGSFAQAGAIDLLGPKYGLPKAIGGHQSYWLWGPREYTGEIVIVIGSGDVEETRGYFNSCEVAAELHHPYARPGENRPVLLCRGLKWPLKEVWPRLKDWD